MIGKYILLLLIIFIINPIFYAQKDVELSPHQERMIQLKDFRKSCRIALRPFRYDGSLTTHFSYKEFDYVKEVEIATIQNENYRLSFNSMGVLHDPITIKIYDKPKKYTNKVLLYETTDVANSEFTTETKEMIEKLKEAKSKELAEKTDISDDQRSYQQKIIENIRLKKLFINYIIPYSERGYKIDEEGNESRVISKGSIILAVGYNNL
ncbi:hypothetical protein OAD79_05415 [Flavobacteriales bacterium]|nr:hypothetical protein [Flavobacteriales bacterium]